MSNTKQDIRRTILKKRQKLNKTSRENAARRLLTACKDLPEWQTSQRIAFYSPVNGEIDPRQVMQWAFDTQKHVFLPCIDKATGNSLKFIAYRPQDALVPNKFGIPEPIIGNESAVLSAQALDMILMPLVAYDANKNRLGMGGGYYDRTLAFTRGAPEKTPYLLGLAYDFQAVDTPLPCDPWDIAMHRVVTVGVHFP